MEKVFAEQFGAESFYFLTELRFVGTGGTGGPVKFFLTV